MPIPTTTQTSIPQTSSSQTPIVETANWESYWNDQYGFGFKYPWEWSIGSYTDGIHWKKEPYEGWSLEMAVLDNPANKSVKEFIQTEESHKDFPYEILNEDIIVAGAKAIKVRDPATIGNDWFIIFFLKPGNQNIFTISSYNEDILNKIVSTLRFGEAGDDRTTASKTHRSEENKFELRYPSIFSLSKMRNTLFNINEGSEKPIKIFETMLFETDNEIYESIDKIYLWIMVLDYDINTHWNWGAPIAPFDDGSHIFRKGSLETTTAIPDGYLLFKPLWSRGCSYSQTYILYQEKTVLVSITGCLKENALVQQEGTPGPTEELQNIMNSFPRQILSTFRFLD